MDRRGITGNDDMQQGEDGVINPPATSLCLSPPKVFELLVHGFMASQMQSPVGGWGVGKWLHPPSHGTHPQWLCQPSSPAATSGSQLQQPIPHPRKARPWRYLPKVPSLLRAAGRHTDRAAYPGSLPSLVIQRHHYLLFSTTLFHRRLAVPIAVAFASASTSASPQPWLLPA